MNTMPAPGIVIAILLTPLSNAIAVPTTTVEQASSLETVDALQIPLVGGLRTPVCFTPESLPFANPEIPLASDCEEVRDLFIAEDARREYQLCSFGDKDHFEEGDVDFLLPMTKNFDSCMGGLAIEHDHMTDKIWEDLPTVAKIIPYVQHYCMESGSNLGGGTADTRGMAFLVYGLKVGNNTPKVNNTSMWERLLASQDNVILTPENVS